MRTKEQTNKVPLVLPVRIRTAVHRALKGYCGASGLDMVDIATDAVFEKLPPHWQKTAKQVGVTK